MLQLKAYEVKNTVRINFLNEGEQEQLLTNNAYFRFVLTYGKSFCEFLKCQDITQSLRSYGFKAYNYKTYWESRGIPFEKALMLFLLSKIEPFSQTVGQVGDHYVSEEKWVTDMYQKNFIQMAFKQLKH